MAILKKTNYNKGIEIDLNGTQGNAFYLLGIASKFSRQLMLDEEKIISDMKSSDYENLIKVFDKYFGDYITLYR